MSGASASRTRSMFASQPAVCPSAMYACTPLKATSPMKAAPGLPGFLRVPRRPWRTQYESLNDSPGPSACTINVAPSNVTDSPSRTIREGKVRCAGHSSPKMGFHCASLAASLARITLSTPAVARMGGGTGRPAMRLVTPL